MAREIAVPRMALVVASAQGLSKAAGVEDAMTRSEAKNWAEKALIIWVEGTYSGYVGPAIGSASGDQHNPTAEDELRWRLAHLVEVAISQNGMLPHSRAALRQYVASRRGKSFFGGYTWLDHYGQPRRTTRLMVLQCKEVLSRLVQSIMDEPQIVRLKTILEDVA